MRILLADDIKDTRDMFSLFFALEGYQTQTAENGAQAVAAVKQSTEAFDVLVLDIQMPVMDGWEALRTIRQMPQGQRLPIILFTAHPDTDIKQRALAEGANDLLHKPFLPSEMIERISQVCAKAKAQANS